MWVATSGEILVETLRQQDDGRYTFEDGPYGGSGGDPWTDGGQIHLNGPITGMELRAGSEVDEVRVRYGATWGEWHGGTGGNLYSFDVREGASIDMIQGDSDFGKSSLVFTLERYFCRKTWSSHRQSGVLHG